MAGRVVAGRYRLQSVLGHGGMAAVWRAVDERLDRPVAVKMLDRRSLADPGTVQRFDREAHAIARLAHPTIVAVHDVGVDDGMPYLVMELVEGRSLAAMIADGPLPVDEVVRIGAQVCDALGAAHAAGVIHRDIKPSNILISQGDAVKVCDFGIARLPETGEADLTDPGVTIGTSDYMAPEQATGGPVDARTDLYAFGCLLYAMLTGRPPFVGDGPLTVLWQHVNQPAVPVAAIRPDVPAALDALVGQLLAKHPADRPATADDVRHRLIGAPVTGVPARGHAPVLAPTQTMPILEPEAAAPRNPGRFRLGPAGVATVALAAAAAVAAAVAVGALLAGGPRGPAETPAAPGATAPAVAPTPPTSTAPATTAPAGAVAALQTAIQAQVRTGALDANAARDLSRRVDDVARELARGRTGKAAERAAELRRRLDELRSDGKLTAAGYDAILAGIDQVTRALPPAGDGDD